MAKLVNWHSFEQKLKDKKVGLFTNLDVRRIFGVSKIAATFLLHRYAKNGFIIRLKRGLYTLTDAHLPDLYIANKLYEPSYVSLSFALSYHRVIPETVYEITSVTTKAPRRFETSGKLFSYRRLKENVFTGYVTTHQRGLTFLIAEPEKAFVDATYFRVIVDRRKPISRFDKEKIDPGKALRYAALFENKKLVGVVKTTLKLK
ncbi:MAG: type IV toxin-antitoxin system AbiEi family antitoxin domain-containing protein [bacterium]|nr:type IV toxin-antitoxin system AbiEi family antitoxin domain-containing protein [bacterium]